MNPAPTYLKLALTMFFWGGTWVAARVVVQEVPPLAAAVWRFFFSVVTPGAWRPLDERPGPSVLFGGLLVLSGVGPTQYSARKVEA